MKLVTIKLPKNPEHDPRDKKTGACAVSRECTDVTGEHHTVAVRDDGAVQMLRDRYGHITRVENIHLEDPVQGLLQEIWDGKHSRRSESDLFRELLSLFGESRG